MRTATAAITWILVCLEQMRLQVPGYYFVENSCGCKYLDIHLLKTAAAVNNWILF